MRVRISAHFPNGESEDGEKSKTIIPGYIMDIITEIPEVVNILKQVERDNKINSILGDE